MAEDAHQQCPLCHGHDLGRIVRAGCRDDRHGYPGAFELLQCDGCGHRYLRCGFSPAQLQDLYSNYYPRSKFDLDQYRPSRPIHGAMGWLDGDKASPFRWVPPGVRVLDIGCGFGEALGYHQARGCEVHGVEADDNIRRVAERYGFNVQVGLFDPEHYERGYFDYVTLSQVIEHVTDPVATLTGIARVLKPGGIAVLSTPNADGWGARVFGRRWIHWHAPYHLHFFSDASMRLAAREAGLVVDKVRVITPSDWLHFQWLHLLTFPAAGVPSDFWTSAGGWSLPRKLARAALRLVHALKLNHLATRLFDAVGTGDNRLYFLRKP